MALLTLLRALGIGFLWIAFAEGVLAVLFWRFEISGVGPFAFAAVATGMLAGAMYLSGQVARERTGLREALLFALLWWTLTPLVAGLPFVLQGMHPGAAYFEAASALTTSGAWLSDSAARSSESGMLWRALLQWGGGLVSVAFAAAVFVQPIFVGIETVPPRFMRREEASYFQSLGRALRFLMPAYVILSIIAFIMLLMADASPLESATSALSVVASGGFFPLGAEETPVRPLLAGLLLPFILFSGASFVIVASGRESWRARVGDKETAAYVTVIVIVATILSVFSGIYSAPDVGRNLFNAASLMSTNGVTLGEINNLPIALVAVVIGGSAISTAGGLKILRWLVIFRRVREELRRLVMPRAVFGKAVIEHELGVWMHFIIFTFVLGALVLILTSGGHSFELAVCAAAGVLSNAGPVLQLASETTDGYAIFENPILRAALVGGMILGRIEAVVALALINRGFWRS